MTGWSSARTSRSAGSVTARRPPRHTVAVVAAGEQWPDGGLRPAVEDLWGAGGVVAALEDWADPSPEAAAAVAAYRALDGDLAGALHRSASGHELDALGHGEDVDIAAELDRSVAVPVLVGEFFESR